jgi:hypothetical protein
MWSAAAGGDEQPQAGNEKPEEHEEPQGERQAIIEDIEPAPPARTSRDFRIKGGTPR